MRKGSHHMLFEKIVMWSASETKTPPRKTSDWSYVHSPSRVVCRKSTQKKRKLTTYQTASITIRNPKSSRNSIARLNEKRRKHPYNRRYLIFSSRRNGLYKLHQASGIRHQASGRLPPDALCQMLDASDANPGVLKSAAAPDGPPHHRHDPAPPQPDGHPRGPFRGTDPPEERLHREREEVPEGKRLQHPLGRLREERQGREHPAEKRRREPVHHHQAPDVVCPEGDELDRERDQELEEVGHGDRADPHGDPRDRKVAGKAEDEGEPRPEEEDLDQRGPQRAELLRVFHGPVRHR